MLRQFAIAWVLLRQPDKNKQLVTDRHSSFYYHRQPTTDNRQLITNNLSLVNRKLFLYLFHL